MEYWLKRYGISLLFVTAMVVLAGSILLSTQPGSGLCSADPNFPTCLRNWMNAAGNLATVLVAALALVIAWGQLKANAVMAALPSVNQRIIGGKATTVIARQLADHVRNIDNTLSKFIWSMENQKFSHHPLRETANEIITVWDVAFGDATQVRTVADDVHDIDLENELSTIIQIGLYLHNEGLPIIKLFRRLSTAEDTNGPITAIIDIVTSAENIRRFRELCRTKHREIKEVDDRLVAIVQGAKETRSNLLRIIGEPRSGSPYH